MHEGVNPALALNERGIAVFVLKNRLQTSGYRFDVTVSGDKFEVTAVPLEYGKTGKLSFFIDNTYVIRGGDRNGAAARGRKLDPLLHGRA